MKNAAISLLLLTLCPIFSQAEEQHAPLSSRESSAEIKDRMKRVDEDYCIEDSRELPRESADAADTEHKEKDRVLGFKSKRKKTDQSHLFSFYPQYTSHWFISTNLDGSIIEIEDGSQWKMAPNYSARYWRHGDTLAITPNNSWNSDYNYYVVNKTTGSYVPADLILGPIAFGPWSHWVIGLDSLQGKVFLENGSTWKVSSNDENMLRDWQINDTIIFGRNSSWFSSYDHVLINVNLNQFIHVKQY